jgi:hypothetical protein
MWSCPYKNPEVSNEKDGLGVSTLLWGLLGPKSFLLASTMSISYGARSVQAEVGASMRKLSVVFLSFMFACLSAIGQNGFCPTTLSCSWTAPQTFSQINSTIYIDCDVYKCSPDLSVGINAAKSALANSVGEIVLGPNPSGGCYTMSNGVSFTTNVLLRGVGAEGGQTGPSTYGSGTCINFKPTSGNAFTFSYARSPSNMPGSSGLQNISVINNGCLTTGGCGSSANCIDIDTSTGLGAQNATFQNVACYGFKSAFLENPSTNTNSGNVFINPIFQDNQIGFQLGAITGINVTGGEIWGNGTAVRGDATEGAEISFYGTQFVSNSSMVFDFTRTTKSGAIVNCEACHLESSDGTAPIGDGVWQGNFTDGVAETDANSGTMSFLFRSVGTGFHVKGLRLLSAGQTVTNAFSLMSPAFGVLSVVNASPSYISSAWGGTGSAVLVTSSGMAANALIANGGVPSLSGTGACATITRQKGGSWAGSFECTGPTGSSTVVITPGQMAPNGWYCSASDQTDGTAMPESANSATSCTIKGPVTANDEIVFTATQF